MSKDLNLKPVNVKYVLKLPNVPNWTKEKVAKYTYLGFVEYVEKTKALHQLEGRNEMLVQYYYYDQLYQISKPFFLLSCLISLRILRSKVLPVYKKILYPLLLIGPTSFATSSLISMKTLMNNKFIQKELIKSDKPELLEEYLMFNATYSSL